MSFLSLAKQPNAASLVGILIGTGALTDPTPLALGANQYPMGTGAAYTAKSISALAQLLVADATETAMRTRLGIELASGELLVGNAGGAATPVIPTGDVTVSNTGITTIGAGKVLNTMLASMAANTIKCRANAALGDPGDLAITANTFPVRKSTGNLFAGTISDWMVDSFLFNSTAGTAVTALGATAIGSALFTAVSAAAARTAISADPGLILLSSKTASTSASLDFTSLISSTYDDYVFHIHNIVPTTDGANLVMRVSEDNGANWKSGANDYAWATFGYAAAAIGANDGADTSAVVMSDISNNAANGGSGEFKIFNLNSATKNKHYIANCYNFNAAGYGRSAIANGDYRGDTLAKNAIQFLASSGNLSTGTIRMYGVRKS